MSPLLHHANPNTDPNQERPLSARTIPESPVTAHLPLAAVLWPERADRVSGVLRGVILVALGTALLTMSAKINLPLPYVPMTLQTLVVLMIGATYGWRLGAATVLAYLAEGAMGLPVFAGPLGGLAPLFGPTAGYLAGFVIAAFATGWLSERGWDRSVPLLFVAMAVGHIVILGCGFAWLAFGMKLGVEKAWLVGIAPFIAASVIKNALGAALVPTIRRGLDRQG
jgi:biotin transport system substrate-specific component